MKRGDTNLVKIPNVRLFRGDLEKLDLYYPQAGYNKVIRHLVREHLAKLESKYEQRVAAKGLSTPKFEEPWKLKGEEENPQ